MDPVLKVWESPFAVMSNNPILLSDALGDNADKPGFHTVTKNESLSSIAKRFHTTVKDILSLEGNKNLRKYPSSIMQGQEIVLPDLAIDESNGNMTIEEIKKIDFTSTHFKKEGNNIDYGVRQPIPLSNSFNEIDARFSDFLNGSGMTNLVYSRFNPITNDVKNHYVIEGARSEYYKKMGSIYYHARGSNYATSMSLSTESFRQSEDFFNSMSRNGLANYTNYKGKWEPNDVVKTPLTNGMQFVGSCSISIYTSFDAQRLIFVVANSTSKWSYKAHGLLPGSDNVGRTNPYNGNTFNGISKFQTTILNLYIWTESINLKRKYFGY